MSNQSTVRSSWNAICPSCLQDDALDVQAHVLVRLCRDGTDADASGDGSHEWDSDSRLRCGSCGWTGLVRDAEQACKENPEKDVQRLSYTRIEVEAALCAWEHMIERRDAEPYASHFEGLGSAGMRSCAIQAGRIAEAVYLQMQSDGYELAVSFDFDMVPAVLDQLDWKALTDDNQFNGAPYRPDIEALFDALCEANPDDFYRADPKADWMATAKAECIRQWQYKDLLDDHAERTEAAYQSGEKPAEFVKALGEKYDLIPASDWMA